VKSLKPFFTYFGGKWRIAQHYPAPRHDIIVEPFAGSAGYSLRYPDRAVMLCDKFADVVDTWKYLISVSEEEIRGLPDLRPEQSLDDFDLSREQRLLIGWWLNKGTASPCKSPSKWMRDLHGKPAASQFWGYKVRERIASQLPAIRHWSVYLCDYSQIEDTTATWFIDPPYQGAGKDYKCSARAIDFDNLGEWCRMRDGQVIVCENEGAAWLPFKTFRNVKATHGAARSGRSAEVIWYKETEA